MLVRYPFPGRRIIDGLVDLPFALPTAIAGIALTTLYTENGWVGQFLSFKVAFTPLGITLALTFIGLPFVVRTVQPVLQSLEKEMEEASACLGANRLQTFIRVIFPELLACCTYWFRACLCSCTWRIWVGSLYCRKYADEDRNYPAVNHDKAGTI